MGWFPSKQERLDKKLWKAVREHDLRRVADLLAEGANPNVRNAKGETPLFVAVGSEMDDMLYDTYGSRNPSCYEANIDLARILIEAEPTSISSTTTAKAC